MGRRLQIEWLEERNVPATFTVTNTADWLTPGSLRQAIADANATAEPDTIEFSDFFDSAQTIALGGELLITHPLTIDGKGANLTTISGGGVGRVFEFATSDNITLNSLRGLTLTGGKAPH